MKHGRWAGLLLAAPLLAGCWGSEESKVTETAKGCIEKEKVCLRSSVRKDTDYHYSYCHDEYRKGLAALSSEGVIQVAACGTADWVRVTFSAMGQPYYDDKVGDFCVGTTEFASTKSYTVPAADAMGRVVTVATIVHKVTGLPEWATRNPVRAAFPTLDRAIADGVTHEVKLVQTNKGWECARY